MTTPDALEANYLDVLWHTKGHSPGERMAALTWLATIVIPRDASWEYAAVRADAPPFVLEHGCFVCLSEDFKTYRHHAIQIQHGGSNSPRNVVTLCHACHQKIHPWLDPSNTYERRGFTKVGDMITKMIERLQKLFDARQ